MQKKFLKKTYFTTKVRKKTPLYLWQFEVVESNKYWSEAMFLQILSTPNWQTLHTSSMLNDFFVNHNKICRGIWKFDRWLYFLSLDKLFKFENDISCCYPTTGWFFSSSVNYDQSKCLMLFRFEKKSLIKILLLWWLFSTLTLFFSIP